MKKIICVLLSAVLMFSALGVFAFAEDEYVPYVNAWTLTVDDSSSSKIAVQMVKNFGTDDAPVFKIVTNEDGSYALNTDGTLSLVEADSKYVKDGEDVYFIIYCGSDYRPDQTTRYRLLSETYKLQVLSDEDTAMVGEELTVFDTVDATVYKDKIPVDGREPAYEDEPTYDLSVNVYHISEIDENKIVKVYNLQTESISDVKDFLLNFYRFFLQLLKWFFGLDVDIP